MPGTLLMWVLITWLTAMSALLVYRVVVGQITLNGLLTIDGRTFSPERLQLLLITVAGAVTYAGQALSTGQLPAMESPGDAGLFAALAGSHAIYLVGKLMRR